MAAREPSERPCPRKTKTWLMAAAITACATMTLSASDGRIPIGTVPYTITTSGSYYLTADFVYNSVSGAITISASGVDLDLNGHYIYQISTTLGAYCVYSSGYTNIKISNGKLFGGYSGIWLTSVGSGSITVDHVTASFGLYGINLSGSGATTAAMPTAQVTNNSVVLLQPSGQDCIHVQYFQNGLIASNTLAGGGTAGGTNGGGIVTFQAPALVIEGNTMTNSFYGIDTGDTGLQILKNTCRANYHGIACFNATYVVVAENSVTGNTGNGFYFQSVSGVYRNNLVQGNGTNYNIATSTINNGGGNY